MKVIIIMLLVVLFVFVFSALFYQWIGLFKSFYHDKLGWHMPKKEETRIEGYTETSICKHCDKRIMKDSQGNWFRY